jgi:hypothetical protein
LASTDPTTTVQCDLGRHDRCRGTVFSTTSAHGALCSCWCHQGDDEQVDLLMDRERFEAAA